MIPADTVTHAITLTVEKRPAGLLPLFVIRCKCGWSIRTADRDVRDEQVAKHRLLTGAEVVR